MTWNIVTTYGLFMFFIYAPILFYLGYLMLKRQKAFLKYLKETYPDTWRLALRWDPYKEGTSRGLTSVAYYTTEEDFGDEDLKAMKASLRKIEYIYWGYFLVFPISLFLIAYCYGQ